MHKRMHKQFLHRHKSTAVWSKLTPNSMTTPCHLSRFYLFSMLKHDMDFGQVQVMEFPWHLLRKWWDFPCGFGLIPEPNQTPVKKTWDNPCHIFDRVTPSSDFPQLSNLFGLGSKARIVVFLKVWDGAEGDEKRRWQEQKAGLEFSMYRPYRMYILYVCKFRQVVLLLCTLCMWMWVVNYVLWLGVCVYTSLMGMLIMDKY